MPDTLWGKIIDKKKFFSSAVMYNRYLSTALVPENVAVLIYFETQCSKKKFGKLSIGMHSA